MEETAGQTERFERRNSRTVRDFSGVPIDPDSHLVLTGNATFDLVAPASGGPRRTTPFLAVGRGVFQTRESFFGGTFTSSEGAFTAGGGVRALVSDRVTVGIDVRAGWELHLRVNGTVGLTLWR